jgi:hypothetical protein
MVTIAPAMVIVRRLTSLAADYNQPLVADLAPLFKPWSGQTMDNSQLIIQFYTVIHSYVSRWGLDTHLVLTQLRPVVSMLLQALVAEGESGSLAILHAQCMFA